MDNQYHSDELQLRRRLLFRILRNFDFDAPSGFSFEHVSMPVDCELLNEWSDAERFSVAYDKSA